MTLNNEEIFIVGNEFVNGKIQIGVGGDQMVRCHMDSARRLRAGTDEALVSFCHLTPILEELFHVQQDFLEVNIPTTGLT